MHILGELPLKEGMIKMDGSISYAPQEPWIMSTSVKNNILFGQAMDWERYLNVINVCGLQEVSHSEVGNVGEKWTTVTPCGNEPHCLEDNVMLSHRTFSECQRRMKQQLERGDWPSVADRKQESHLRGTITKSLGYSLVAVMKVTLSHVHRVQYDHEITGT